MKLSCSFDTNHCVVFIFKILLRLNYQLVNVLYWIINLFYITGPTNDYTGFFLGFSVYVSNTTNRQTGTLCFKDNNFTLETIPAVVTVVCPVHGQYVIYYNERLANVIYPVGYPPIAENNVCEIEVYGEYSWYIPLLSMSLQFF